MGVRRLLVWASTVVLIAAACGGNSDGGQTTTTTTPTSTTAPSTTAPPSSTTATTRPTTTTGPPPEVAIDLGDAPDGLADAIDAFYTWAGNTSYPPPDLPPGLTEVVTGADPFATLQLEGRATVADLAELGTIAVATFENDIVLAVADPGQPWRIVGAHLARFGLPPWYGESPRMVLVLGSDARPGQNQQRYRADSIHIVTAVPGAGAGTILGFPRDTQVQGPDGPDKFTHIMAGRGPQAMMDVALELTGLPIEGYFVTGFKNFTELVDAFGRFTVDLPERVPSWEGWPSWPAGESTVTSGDAALKLARVRKTLPRGDFDRSRNQGVIMLGALIAVQDRGIRALPGLLALLVQYVWTDLDAEALLTLGASAYTLDFDKVENLVLPGTGGTNSNGAYVVFLDDSVEETYRDLEDGVLDE